jgi:membrane protease YdiL (CAAX protease family)
MAATLRIDKRLNQGRKEKTGWREPVRKTGLFILFLSCAIAIFVFGSNYYSFFPTNKNLLYEGSLAAAFLIAAILLRWKSSFKPYWQIAYAFFVADCVILVTSLTVSYRDVLFQRIGLAIDTSQGMAGSKVFEALLTIGTILLLSRLAGLGLESLYVKKGRLRWGLIIGFGVLVNFASSSLMFFAGRFTSLEKMGAALLWGLVFSFANGFMEELWLRGQFLKKLEPVLGPGLSIVLTSLWFALFHVGAVYMTPLAIPFYLANLFTFALAWGVAMRKTDSWIAPGLMHAASDFFLFIAMLSPA